MRAGRRRRQWGGSAGVAFSIAILAAVTLPARALSEAGQDHPPPPVAQITAMQPPPAQPSPPPTDSQADPGPGGALFNPFSPGPEPPRTASPRAGVGDAAAAAAKKDASANTGWPLSLVLAGGVCAALGLGLWLRRGGARQRLARAGARQRFQ